MDKAIGMEVVHEFVAEFKDGTPWWQMQKVAFRIKSYLQFRNFGTVKFELLDPMDGKNVGFMFFSRDSHVLFEEDVIKEISDVFGEFCEIRPKNW